MKAFAQNPYENIPDLNPPAPFEGYASSETSVEDFLIATLNYFLGFLGIISLLFLVYGGYLWITALGREDQVGKAKKIIMGAFIGIFIILGSYAVVNTILTARQFLLPI